MILIDSTVWIDWLRLRVEPQRILGPWVRARAAASCGTVRLEVLRGVLKPEQKARLEELFTLLWI